MIINREKENGTLTDTADKKMIELLDITCGYPLKNELELKKKVKRKYSGYFFSERSGS